MEARQANTWIDLADQDHVYVECPVCGDDDACSYGEADVDVSVDVESDGRGGYHPYIDGGWKILRADSFACGACGLRLNNPDELKAAGLESEVSMPMG